MNVARNPLLSVLASLSLPWLLSLNASCSSEEMMMPPDPNPMQTDTAPPSFGGAFSAVAAPSGVTVSWNPATDDRTPSDQIVYQIYQATAAGAESFASPSYNSVPGGTSFNVGGLAPDTQYFFVVRARDSAGNVDSNTVEVNAKTPDQSDKQPPNFGGLVSAISAGTSIKLNWVAASDNVSMASQIVYHIYQATAAGAENYAAAPTYTTQLGATSYVVPNLNINTRYYFVVRAQDVAGNSDSNMFEKDAQTTVTSLSEEVQPIFNARCAGCHGGAMPRAMLNLSSVASSYTGLVGVTSRCPGVMRVAAGDAGNSYLLWKLAGAPPPGLCFMGVQMPAGGTPLSAGEIKTITNWILGGALNN